LLHHVHEEIPYIADIECTSIVNINMHHTRVKIDANIWVDSHRQQKILVGGSNIVQYQTYL
jgi:GTPase Era involved in 16S rRNA processing